MKNIKIPALIMAVAILFSAAACDNKSSEKSGDTTAAVTEGESSGLFVADYLPDTKYDGYKFRVLTIDQDNCDIITTFDIDDASTVDTVYAAIYKRNAIIEDRYNITFEQTEVPQYYDLSTKFQELILANSDEFDLNMLIQRDAFSYALQGYIVGVNELPYVDITQSWYVQDVNSQFTIGGKTLFAYSDECLNMFEQTICMLYNKSIITDNQFDDPYKLVSDGTWTIDKMLVSAANAVSDVNGNGKITDEDILGIVSEADMLYPTFWIGAGINTVTKDSDDIPSFTVGGSGDFMTLMSDVLGYVNKDGVIFDSYVDKATVYASDDNREVSRQIFEAGNALYRVCHVGALKNLHSMEDDFGVVPFPKYDDSQANYYSRVIDGWINVVPITNSNLDRTSVIMESLAVESKNYVYDAYYEIALKNRHTRDNQSIEMMDLIFNTRTVDLGDTIWQGIVRNVYINLFWDRNDSFKSKTDSVAKALNSKIAQDIKQITASSGS